MANAQSTVLHASGQEVASGSGPVVDIGALRTACTLTLTVTEVTGDDLAVVVETSPDGSTGWRQVGAFSAVPSVFADVETLHLMGCSQFLRVSWTLGTTATFAVSGKAHQLMASMADFRNEVPPALLDQVPVHVVAYALIVASTDAEDAISRTNPVPLTEWSPSVVCRVGRIAAYHVLKYRGYDPESMDAEAIRGDMRDAIKWLQSVSSDEVRPPGLEPASNLVPKSSSGDARRPQVYPRKFTTNWGDF